ncbi:MAG: hypothetical protein ACJA16_001828 [Akkermansiaceae bacterium]|jgi:hypothetical protein
MKEAAAIQRSGISDSAFYAKMVAGLKDKSVKQESFLMVRSDPSLSVTGEQIQEYIYPTEYEPPGFPRWWQIPRSQMEERRLKVEFSR